MSAKEVLANVQYLDWKVEVINADGYSYLRWRFYAPDSKQPYVEKEWTSRKWLLSPHMTESEIVGTAFKALLTVIEHEMRERFQYRERAIFSLHISIHALWGACAIEDIRP